MRWLWALATLAVTLVMSVWAAFKAPYVVMVEGVSLTLDILTSAE